jgi:hypothetical protein
MVGSVDPWRLGSESNRRINLLMLAQFSQIVELVRDHDTVKVLHALVAPLTFHSHAHRNSMRNGQVETVHAIGQDRLRVQGIEHIDAVAASSS